MSKSWTTNRSSLKTSIPQSEAEAAFLAASTNTNLEPILKINKDDMIDLMDIGYRTTDTTRVTLNGVGKAVIVPEHYINPETNDWDTADIEQLEL